MVKVVILLHLPIAPGATQRSYKAYSHAGDYPAIGLSDDTAEQALRNLFLQMSNYFGLRGEPEEIEQVLANPQRFAIEIWKIDIVTGNIFIYQKD